jgi:hypothetical protein
MTERQDDKRKEGHEVKRTKGQKDKGKKGKKDKKTNVFQSNLFSHEDSK